MLKRWITSLVLTPFVILLIYKGTPTHFALFAAAASVLALSEYFGIALPECKKFCPHFLPAYIFSPLIIWSARDGSFEAASCLLTLSLMISGIISVALFKRDKAVTGRAAVQIFGTVYIAMFLSCTVLTRGGHDGTVWTFLLLTAVFSGDTGSYYIGTYLGKHPLCPSASPKKTMEGALGGLAATACVCLTLKFFFLAHLSWSVCLILSLLVGVSAQIGDLFESVLKRTSNIKDSGTILPGHGGFLDRIDGILFAAPVVYFFQKYLSGS